MYLATICHVRVIQILYLNLPLFSSSDNWLAKVKLVFENQQKTAIHEPNFNSKADQLSYVSACFIGSQVSCLLSYKGFCCV